jgi:hypothetical protein
MTDLPSSALKSELYNVYQDGKMKRYSLLWAVNGGAFAILKFSLEQSTPAGQGSCDAPAGTSLINDAVLFDQLPAALIAFTLLIFFDIWKFGWMMRRQGLDQYAFQCAGQFILIAMSALIATGWTLIGALQETTASRPWMAGAVLLVWCGLILAIGLASEPDSRRQRCRRSVARR